MKKSAKSIFSITRATYFNSGYISTFLIDYADFFAVLSISSHHTGKGSRTKLIVFSSGELVKEMPFITLPLNPPIYLVPFYQIYYVIAIVYAFLLLRFKFKIKPNLCLSSSSVWALTAQIMRYLGFCEKTLYWMWDYFPLVKNSPYYYLLLFLSPLDKLAIRYCDFCWYASESNFEKRIELGQVKNSDDPKHKVVHWGTGGDIKTPVKANFSMTGILRLVYFGSIDYEKGLSLVFDNLVSINDLTNGKFELLIIGGSTPYWEELKDCIPARLNDRIRYRDFMTIEEFSKYAFKSDLGLALYVPEVDGEPNFTYYADPAKPRDYLAYGLPMVITKVPFIHKDIEKYEAGLVLDDFSKESLLSSLEKYMKDSNKYKEGAFKLSQVDRFDVYYKRRFDKLFYDHERA